jgi:hypothetical protein
MSRNGLEFQPSWVRIAAQHTPDARRAANNGIVSTLVQRNVPPSCFQRHLTFT